MSNDRLHLNVAPKGMGLRLHAWDFSRFSRGERFVYEPIPRAEFDEVLAQVERWGLDDFLTDRSFDNLTYHVTP